MKHTPIRTTSCIQNQRKYDVKTDRLTRTVMDRRKALHHAEQALADHLLKEKNARLYRAG